MDGLSEVERRAIARIAEFDDPEKLRTVLANAGRAGAQAVGRAAFARLCEVLAGAGAASVAHEVRQAMHALGEMRRARRERGWRLTRTRQKITRDSEVKTVADLVLKPEPSQGFLDLIELGHPELFFEAVALRHPEVFHAEVRRAAEERLRAAGVNPAALGRPGSR